MKLIKSVTYYQLDADDPSLVEARVVYTDDTFEVLWEEEDLHRLQRQIQRQSRSLSDPLRP